ncbi:MAG: hypothetical protein ACE5NW_02865 [Acidiferrobacterales bacterium]
MQRAINGMVVAPMLQFFVLVALLTPTSLLAERITITADQWARPRSGEAIVGLAGLNKLIEALDSRPDTHILIRHAAGENGTLWAEELRSWLVSLGVPSRRITLSVGLDQNDAIVVETGP